jgi:thiol-disulfide isomerase/thioredoxin
MEVQHIIKSALENSIPYSQYRALMEAHVLSGSNTGAEVTADLANYTMLNNQRMKRLDKTLKLLPETEAYLEELDKKILFLVITESWCGDAAQTIPMIHKMAEAGGIHLHVVLRDDNEMLMDQFLTNGNKSIAKLILVNAETYEPLNSWGPRPTGAMALVAQELAQKGSLSPDFKQELQNWYNNDKGKDTEQDLVNLLKQL